MALAPSYSPAQKAHNKHEQAESVPGSFPWIYGFLDLVQESIVSPRGNTVYCSRYILERLLGIETLSESARKSKLEGLHSKPCWAKFTRFAPRLDLYHHAEGKSLDTRVCGAVDLKGSIALTEPEIIRSIIGSVSLPSEDVGIDLNPGLTFLWKSSEVITVLSNNASSVMCNGNRLLPKYEAPLRKYLQDGFSVYRSDGTVYFIGVDMGTAIVRLVVHGFSPLFL